MVTAFYASWTPFKFTIKTKKANVHQVLYSRHLSRCPEDRRQTFRVQISGVGRSSSYFMSSGGCHSLGTMFQSWNSECKSLADETLENRNCHRPRRLPKFSSKHHLRAQGLWAPRLVAPSYNHGWGLLENLGTSRWTVNHSLNIDLNPLSRTLHC